MEGVAYILYFIRNKENYLTSKKIITKIQTDREARKKYKIHFICQSKIMEAKLILESEGEAIVFTLFGKTMKIKF